MTIEVIRDALGWCTLINFAIIIAWALMFILAHDWMYRMHRTWFKIPVETFDSIHYAGMAVFKLSIIVLNLVPYLALRIV